MPTLTYYFTDTDVYPDELGMPDFSVEISMEEYNRRIEQEHHWESNGRMARREISVFDAMLAEIYAEHDGNKAKVRNRRKADRKAKRKSGAYVKRNGGDFRKDEHYAGDGRMWHDYVGWEHTKSQTGGKIRERSLRKDFEIEQDNIADAMTEYSDYCIMAEDHAKRKEILQRELMTIMVNDDWFAVMSEELCRGIRYEGERVKEMRNIAESIMKGECY